MTYAEFKKRWLMSKLHPIYFYLPWGSGKRAFDPDRFTFSIVPMTQIVERTFQPNPQGAYAVPFYSFAPNKKGAQPCANLSIRYRTTTQSEEIDNLGCLYKIYQYQTDEETDTFQYVPVSSNGTPHDITIEKELWTFHKDTVSFSLPQGTYKYREYLSHEGDIVIKTPIEFTIFKKDENYEEPSKEEVTIIHDWRDEEGSEVRRIMDKISEIESKGGDASSWRDILTAIENDNPDNPPEDDPEKYKDILYMQYLDFQDDDNGILHETYNGFKYYKEESDTIGEKSIVSDNLQWKIYHEPKLIKTYTTYTTEQEQGSMTKASDYYASEIWWSLWHEGLGPGLECNFSGDPQAVNINKIIVDHVMIKSTTGQSKNLTPQAMERSDSTYCVGKFKENKMEKTDLIINAKAMYCDGWTMTLNQYANKKWSYEGCNLTSSYFMSWSDVQAGDFSHRQGETVGTIYKATNPSGLNAPGGSGDIDLSCCFGSGVWCDRSGGGSLDGNSIIVSVKANGMITSNTKKEWNSTVLNVTLNTNDAKTYTKYIVNGETTESFDEYEGGDSAQGYVGPEDTAQFALQVGEMFVQTDMEEPEFNGGYLIPRAGGSAQCFYRITGYEDEQENVLEVKEETFNYDDNLTYSTELYEFKERRQDSCSSYPEFARLNALGVKKGFGAFVVFSRLKVKNIITDFAGETADFIDSLDPYKTPASPPKKKS